MNKKLLAGLVSALLVRSALAFDPFPIKDIRVEGIQRTDDQGRDSMVAQLIRPTSE